MFYYYLTCLVFIIFPSTTVSGCIIDNIKLVILRYFTLFITPMCSYVTLKIITLHKKTNNLFQNLGVVNNFSSTVFSYKCLILATTDTHNVFSFHHLRKLQNEMTLVGVNKSLNSNTWSEAMPHPPLAPMIRTLLCSIEVPSASLPKIINL